MIGECLNGLALMQIHQEIVPDIGKAIDNFIPPTYVDTTVSHHYILGNRL